MGACALGYAVPALCQETLPPATVIAANYRYLKNVGGKEAAVAAQRLERAAAAYDIKNSGFYEEDYDGRSVLLPTAVAKAIGERFPNWGIVKDVYLVKYFDKNGTAVKKFKLVLQNGTKRIRVQLDEQGQFS